MAPDPSGVTMVLPEAQEQEKGSPEPTDASSGRILDGSGIARKQISPIAYSKESPLALFVNRTGQLEAQDSETLGTHDDPELDSTWPVWINASCGGNPETLTLWVIGVGDVQTPYFTYWDDGTSLIINVTLVTQQRGACGHCVFDQWSDGNQNPEIVLNVTGPTQIVAQFHDEYLVNLDTSPVGLQMEWKGIVYAAPMSAFERPGSYIAYAITPQGGYVFTNWSDESIVNPRTIVVTGPTCTNLTAIYNGLFRVRVTTVPLGLAVSFDGGTAGVGPLEFWVDPGSTHMLLTTSPQPPNPLDTRYRFDRWIDGPTTWGWNVTINEPQTFTANFITQHLITVLSEPAIPIMIGSDIPGCDVYGPSPLQCWADENSDPTLMISGPQQYDDCRVNFVGWSDGYPGMLRPIGPITGPATYVVLFDVQCQLTMKDTCTGNPQSSSWYDWWTEVVLNGSALPAPPPRTRYAFDMWIGKGLGNYTGPESEAKITVHGNITETAVCHVEFLVTVDTNPMGIDFTVDDVNHNGLTSSWWTNKSKHWLNLTVLSFEVGQVRYLFTRWSDGVTLSHRQILVDAPEDYIAYYDRPQVKLTLSPPNVGDIRCVEHADCWYDQFEMATAQVTSPWMDGIDSRYEFKQWSGDASGTDTSANVLMEAPKTAIAEWNVFYHLTVVSAYGNPVCSNTDCWYLNGTIAKVNLEDPFITGTGTRQRFNGWSIDAAGSANPLMLTMSVPKIVSATWNPQFLLTVISKCASISDSGSPTGAGWYDKGKNATVALSEAISVHGGMRCLFTDWSGDASGTAINATVIMDKPMTVTAAWSVQFWLTVTSDCGGSAECETPAGQGWHDNQSFAHLVANATFTDTHGNVWDFNGWAGDATSANPRVAVFMDSPKTVTATWVKQTPGQESTPYTLLIITVAAILVAVILVAALLFYWHRKRRRDEELNQDARELNQSSDYGRKENGK